MAKDSLILKKWKAEYFTSHQINWIIYLQQGHNSPKRLLVNYQKKNWLSYHHNVHYSKSLKLMQRKLKDDPQTILPRSYQFKEESKELERKTMIKIICNNHNNCHLNLRSQNSFIPLTKFFLWNHILQTRSLVQSKNQAINLSLRTS